MKKRPILILLMTFNIQCGEVGTFNNNADHCDGYTDPSSSNYILPYQVGETYEVTQGNCGQVTHFGQQRFAYDFTMPLGTPLIAARSGTVHEFVHDKDDASTDNAFTNTNYLYIVHADGTMSAYVHIQQNSVVVNVGDTVNQGDVIAAGGASGTNFAHLHFLVYRSSKDPLNSIPINFRNAGSVSPSLLEGENITAQTFTADSN